MEDTALVEILANATPKLCWVMYVNGDWRTSSPLVCLEIKDIRSLIIPRTIVILFPLHTVIGIYIGVQCSLFVLQQVLWSNLASFSIDREGRNHCTSRSEKRDSCPEGVSQCMISAWISHKVFKVDTVLKA